jgi:transcriptional regulator with XRE-family HTH domain
VDSDAEMRRRFAYALRAAMTAKDWKVPDLARALGRDPGTVDRWANGKAVPNLFHVKAIAEALGVRPELLYDPPPVPAYPLSDYLVQHEAAEGVQEGLERARRRRRVSGDA